jgi:hypothetical protein
VRGAGFFLGILWASGALAAESRERLPATAENFRSGQSRWFVQSSLSVGMPSRGANGVGYGKPYFRSISLDAVGFATPFFTQAGLALTLGLPIAQLELGAARVRSFESAPLPRQAHYSARDIRSYPGHVTYSALNATLYGLVPLPPFVIPLRAQLVYAPGLGGETALLEPNRYVFRPPLTGFVRLFPMIAIGGLAGPRAGAVTEVIWPGGSAPVIVRVGPSFSADLSAHTDVTVFAEVPLTSPDELKLRYGLGAGVSLRYRAATGERSPDFP